LAYNAINHRRLENWAMDQGAMVGAVEPAAAIMTDDHDPVCWTIYTLKLPAMFIHEHRLTKAKR
jgi:hypothetical protein